jgi:hypothetical protein
VRSLTGSPLSPRQAQAIGASHRQIDGYANAWVLPPGAVYRVTLDYYPQHDVDAGAIIALLSWLICLGVVLAPARARRVAPALLTRWPRVVHEAQPMEVA